MSYEYSSESGRLDVPNPFRVENLFHFIASAILLVGGLALLLVSRSNLSVQLSLLSVAPLVVGVYLVLHGIGYAARAMTQLRFFFGRGEPRGLAQEIAGDAGNGNPQSAAIKEAMRQNALAYKEPVGALNGLLYSVLPHLIFAPHPIQMIAQRQFQTAVAMGVTLLSFLIAWVGFSNGPQSAWLGLFYFAFSAFLLLRPLEYGDVSQTSLGVHGLVVLILAAIFGPVLIPIVAAKLPDISWLSLNGQTLLLLLAALGAVLLFFIALTKQLIAPPRTTMGCETLALSFNAHPKQLLDELDRELQANWVEKIPNRRYEKKLPGLTASSGEFISEILEETQPMPAESLRRFDFANCFTQPRYQWLAWFNIFGLVLMLIAVVALVLFGAWIKPAADDPKIMAFATFGTAMLLVAHFCFKAGHRLWERFDFLSELVWVEMKGNYQSAKMDFGNQLTDHIKTQKQIINIETMTLRVWVAQIETVSFGKGAPRWLVGMAGLPDKARQLSDHLNQFAGNQSMIVAPTAQADIQKIGTLGALNKFGGNATTTLPKEMQALLVQQAGTVATASQQCGQCGTSNDAYSLFCTNCGAALGYRA